MTVLTSSAVWLHTDEGTHPLAVDRWFGAATPADRRLLDRVVGPVADLGCGPGRLVAELQRRGVTALGVDASPTAMAACRRRRLPVLGRCVFDRLPREGSWGSALLVDGNIGIGGDPRALLRRVATLVRPGGRLLVELADPDRAGSRGRARLETGAGPGSWFDWAVVTPADLEGSLGSALGLLGVWTDEDRWFAEVRRR